MPEQSVKELMALGLSEAEAERVINRNAKVAKQTASAKARAEKALPKLNDELEHALGRVAHWQAKADAVQAKIDKYSDVVRGETIEEPVDASE